MKRLLTLSAVLHYRCDAYSFAVVDVKNESSTATADSVVVHYGQYLLRLSISDSLRDSKSLRSL